MRKGILLICWMLFAGLLLAMTDEPERLKDNSFLIEEAYNQDPGVVQHFSLWQYQWKTGAWSNTINEEWPLSGVRHQISLTLPLLHLTEDTTATGLGDVALNYRYLLITGSRLAVAPRLSVLMPTGRWRKGLGTGAWGFQLGLPLSVELGSRWVTHWNLGCTWIPGTRNLHGDKADTLGFNYGASAIYALSTNLNLMLEAAGGSGEKVSGPGLKEQSSYFILNPALRAAFNFKSGLQVVCGIGFPVDLGPSRGESGVILYLSFEHPLFNVE